ncbi:sugar phosphate isomerase/epimerase family protein [Oerskovia sp. NPDC056781]|uniref:sugar phosphate isomerase/epimerase family protein n=1 Tax=Oerskovia sp. NPDC056781 TaxID=3345942 RepID=UPI003671F718
MSAPLAVQLWSVHTLAGRDLPGVLGRVAEIGFAAVEPISLYGRSPAQFRSLTDGFGLEICSAHAPFPAGDDGERTLDTYEELGVDTLVWSLEPEELATRDTMLRGLERVNDGARRAARRGMAIAYHNHFAEFTASYDGELAYDALLAALDPSVVIELDMYWVAVAGLDPAAVAARLGPRVRLLHAKDGPARGMSDQMVALGDGTLDVGAAVRACSALDWCIVELDRTAGDMFEALARSADHLTRRGLAHGRAGAGPAARPHSKEDL